MRPPVETVEKQRAAAATQPRQPPVFRKRKHRTRGVKDLRLPSILRLLA
jgi:hypothetical protein